MSEIAERSTPSPWLRALATAGVLAIGGALAWAPDQLLATAIFVGQSLIDVAPLVIPGIVLAAWITASGGGVRVAGLFDGRVATSIVAASLIGAITPVCGVTVLPLMAGLLLLQGLAEAWRAARALRGRP